MGKVVYNNKGALFFKALKLDIEAYFIENKLAKTGHWELYFKSVILIASAIGIYSFLLFFQYSALIGISLSTLLGLILAGIGFNVMHDANHGSYSSKKWVNDTLGLTINALGSNAFIWKQKHNIIHHTYTNVDGVDDDIAKSPILRHSPTQTWKPAHRIQHIYLWVVYAFSSILWLLFTDFVKYATQKIHNTQIKNMDTKEHIIFWFSKILYIVFYMGLPIYLLGFGPWLVGFLFMHFALGLSLAVVFQLAHTVEETEFEYCAADDELVIENEWAIHQLKTTANFAPGNPFLTWFLGGLNYQVEHHLFPRISHIHYPALSKIVAAKCKEFGIPYHSIPTMGEAVVSHYKYMRSMGAKPEEMELEVNR